MPTELRQDTVPTDTAWIHSTFWELKKISPDFMEDFLFDEDDMFPYSPVLEEAIANLQLRDELQRKNPKMATYDVNASPKKYTSGPNKLDKNEAREVKAISKRLQAELRMKGVDACHPIQ